MVSETYRPGDVVNGHQWTGSGWTPSATFVPPPRNVDAHPKPPWYRRPWLGVLAGMLGAIVIISAAIGAPDQAPAATQTHVSAEPEEHLAPAVGSAPVTYTGNGDTVQRIDAALGPDRAVLTIGHSGTSNVIVRGMDEDLQATDLLVNEIGAYQGSMLLEPGIRALQIEADGAWVVSVAPLSSMRTFDDRIRGSGGAVVVYTGERGIARFSHDGRGAFVVWEYAAGSKYGHLAVMKLGTYTGETVISGGPNTLVIEADGDWSVDVEGER